jgi:hypothetical protein
MLTVVLLGNSIALSGVGASLEARPGLRVVHADGASTFAEELGGLEPDVAVFDLATNEPDVVDLWRRHPGVLPVGVDLLSHQAVVFSRESSSVLTTDDLLHVIEGRKAPRKRRQQRGGGRRCPKD